jgi:hypothetical protein
MNAPPVQYADSIGVEDRGQTGLKGIPGEWRLFTLSGGI